MGALDSTVGIAVGNEISPIFNELVRVEITGVLGSNTLTIIAESHVSPTVTMIAE